MKTALSRKHWFRGSFAVLYGAARKLTPDRNLPIFQRHHGSARLQTWFAPLDSSNNLQHQKGKDERADVWERCVFDLLNLKDFQVRRDGKKTSSANKKHTIIVCLVSWNVTVIFASAPPPPPPSRLSVCQPWIHQRQQLGDGEGPGPTDCVQAQFTSSGLLLTTNRGRLAALLRDKHCR